MKTQWTVLAIAAAFLASGAVFADDATAPAKHPCHQLEDACKGAGFSKGQAKSGKGLWKDCMKPLMAGQAVSGVTVDPTLVPACQAKKAARKK